MERTEDMDLTFSLPNHNNRQVEDPRHQFINMNLINKIVSVLEEEEPSPGLKPDFCDILAIVALLVVIIAPAFVHEGYWRTKEYTILTGCWDASSGLVNIICVLLMVLPISFIVMNHITSQRKLAIVAPLVSGFISIEFYSGRFGDISNYYEMSGALLAYSFLCIGGVLASYSRKRWNLQRSISAVALCIVAYICFYSLPFLGRYGYIELDGSTILDLWSESDDLWPKAFLIFPLIAALLAIAVRSKIGPIISAVILFIPWFLFAADAPEDEHTELLAGAVLYFICIAGLIITAFIEAPDNAKAESTPSVPSKADDMQNSNLLFGYTGIGFVTAAVAIIFCNDGILSYLFSSSAWASFFISSFSMVCFGSLIYFARKSVSKVTLFAIAGLIVFQILFIIVYKMQQSFIENQDFEALNNLGIFYLLNEVLLIVSLVCVVAKRQGLKRSALLTYLAIPVLCVLSYGCSYLPTLGFINVDSPDEMEQFYHSTLPTIWTVKRILQIVVAVALVFLNRPKKEA